LSVTDFLICAMCVLVTRRYLEAVRCWHDNTTEETSDLYYNWDVFLARRCGIR